MSAIVFRSVLPAAIARAGFVLLRALRALAWLSRRRRRRHALDGLSDHIRRDIGMGHLGPMKSRKRTDPDWADPRR